MAQQKQAKPSPEPNQPEEPEIGPAHPTSDMIPTKKTSSSKPITDVQYTDISVLMNPGSEKRQGMKGFDDDYVDIVDYIVRCTHKIWEEGAIGLIYTHYNHNAIIHTSDGMIYGVEKVVENTIQRQAAFPNAKAFADDVIWSGNDEDGFHSSHRVVNVARNTGYSMYGPPTGRWVTRWGVAHCLVKENRIVEEWIAHDGLTIVRQLGLDEHALAKKLAAQDAAKGIKPPQAMPQGEIERLRGQLPPEVYPAKAGPEFNPEDFVRRSIHEIWNWRMLNKINEYYTPNYNAFVSTHRTLYGWGDYKMHVLGLLAAFPDALVQVDHVCWLPNGPGGYRVATRWTIQGTHDGPGVYGQPTGKRIRLMGVSHHIIQNGKFVKEWTVFDEFMLLKQLYAPD
jgi:predicted ester cyclase